MFEDSSLTRKQFLTAALAAAAASALPKGLQGSTVPPQNPLTIEDLRAAEKLFGIEFTEEELRQILTDLQSARGGYASVRRQPITYRVEPPTPFRPLAPEGPEGPVRLRLSRLEAKRPQNETDLAFMSVRQLGHLVRTKQVSPVELTRLFLARLEKYDPLLLCVVTLTPELAMAQAKRAEQEIAQGRYRGPLHGIPYGIKDLFATKGIPTTWGGEPYKDQVFDYDATVVQKLEQAGAILLAKLSLGALAQGDVWFRGMTKNPWNPQQGSSGSSAGSASAVAAGLVPFAIGTETLGSIVSPSIRCRTTGLRPTYGRVSRAGAMAVSWTMDKVGPICREVEDCAVVFAAICGEDPQDRTTIERAFDYNSSANISKLKIGYLVGANDDLNDRSRERSDPMLLALAKKGATLRPVRFENAPAGLLTILQVESSAAFEEITRTGGIRELKNSSWPRTYRANRFVPAVEYLQAQRARTLLMESFDRQWGDLDGVVGSGNGGNTLVTTNLTGHPQVVIPFGVTDGGVGTSVSFIGRPYGEATLLSVAKVVQETADWHRRRPPLFG